MTIPCVSYLTSWSSRGVYQSWAVKRWNLSSESLLLSLFLKSTRREYNNGFIWFLSIRLSGTLVFYFLTSAQVFLFLLPSKGWYVGLIWWGEECNSCYAYCQVKGWYQKSARNFQNDWKGLNNKWWRGRENGLTQKWSWKFSPTMKTMSLSSCETFGAFFFFSFIFDTLFSLSLFFSMLRLFIRGWNAGIFEI